MKNILKSLVLLSASVLPIASLTSCSSSLSQYGLACKVNSNYQALSTTETNQERKVTFDIGFDNTTFSSSSVDANSNKYQKNAWNNTIFPNYAFLGALLNLALLDLNLSNDSSNFYLFQNSSTDLGLIKEFLLASSNVFNQGRSGQIKFGVVGMELTFSFDPVTNPPTTPETPKTSSNTVYAQVGDILNVTSKEEQDSKTAIFDPNCNMKIKYLFGYWNPEIDSPNQPHLGVDVVKQYVDKYHNWPSGITPTKSAFEIEFNISTYIQSRYTGLEASFKNATTGAETESGQTISQVTMAKEDFDKIDPNLEIKSFEYLNSFTPNLPTGTTFDSKLMNEDIQKIATLITHYATENKDTSTLNELRNRYKGVFKLIGLDTPHDQNKKPNQ